MLSLSLSGTVFSLSSPALTPTRQPHRPLLLDEHLAQPTLSTEAKLGGINFELFVLRQVAAHRQYSHATICAARVRSVQAIAQLPPAKRQMPSRSNRQNSPNLRSFHPIRSAARIAVAGPALDSVARCARLQAPAWRTGSTLCHPWFPGAFDDFVDQVVPILQRRGLFRMEYAGRTLRDHLNLPRPPHSRLTTPSMRQTTKPE
jgi:hypothetical protein